MRLTSQQLRQFVVTQGDALDPYILAENVALFNADGTSFEGGDDTSALVWRGPWAEGINYNAFDVVSYDPGSDPGIYIFNQSVSALSYLFETYPLDALLTEDMFPVSMVIDGSLSRSDNLSGSNNPFRAYGIKIAEAGQLHLSTAPDDTARDMMAVLFRLDDDGETWITVAGGDDEAGFMHPAINTAVTPGVYLFAFTIFGGDDPDRYGTSTLTLGGSNTAVLGTWDTTASFPVDSVTRLVAESGGSRLPIGGADGDFLAKASATDGDVEWVPAPIGGDGGTGGGSGDMQFFEEWTPGSYPEQSVVTRDNKLWITLNEIVAIDFAQIGMEAAHIDTGTMDLDVPVGTEVGDLLIWSGTIASFSDWADPSDVTDWTPIAQTPLEAVTYPAGRSSVYAKIAEESDLGDTKNCTVSVQAAVELRVFRGAKMPDPDETDITLSVNHTFGTPLSAPAQVDPAETAMTDKVMRVFGAYSQNYSYDSGSPPTWESSSDDQDNFLQDDHQVLATGSYWSDAGVSNPPDFQVNSGEHKYASSIAFCLASPVEFSEDDWTQIGVIEATANAMRWSGAWDIAESYEKNDVVYYESAIWNAPSTMGSGAEPTTDIVVPKRTARAYAFGNYAIASTPILYRDIPFTDMGSAPSAGVWMGGSKMVCFDANPGSSVTITTVGGAFVPYKDTGAPGSGNSEIIGSAHSYNSPQTFTMPAEGKVSVEIAGGVTSITISGSEVAEPTPSWELILEGTKLLALYDAPQYNSMSTSYVYSGTEQIVVPADGDYEVSMSCWLAIDNTSTGNEVRAGVAVDGVVDAGATVIKSALSSSAYAVDSHSIAGRVLSLTAGDIIRPMYKVVGTGLGYIEQVKIVLHPVTVA